MSRNYPSLARYSRQLMLISYLALLAVIALGTLVMPSCDRQPNVVVWCLYSLPLLAFLPAVLRSRRSALAWLCFVLLMYFLFAVLSAFTCQAALSNIEVLLTCVLFAATMMHIRWHSLAEKMRMNHGAN